MGHGTQDEERTSPAPSTGARILWVATVAVAAVAITATLFAVNIVLWYSRDNSRSIFLEGGGGWTLGVVCGLLLAGAVLLLVYTVTGRTPTGKVMGGVALTILLLMQVALFVTGEYGERTADVSTAAKGRTAEACSEEDVALLQEITDSLVVSLGGDAGETTEVDPTGVGGADEGRCVAPVPGDKAVLLAVMDSDGWTLVEQADGRYTFERDGQQVEFAPRGDEFMAGVLP